MGKIHNYTAIAVIVFIAIMIFLMIQPMDFLNDNIEQIHQKNEGLIWIIGLILAALLLWRTYANGVFQSEIKKCTLLNKEKNIQIAVQNDRIIENQETYIREIRILNVKITENSEKDLQTLKIIQDQGLRITKNEKSIQAFLHVDKRLNSIERLLKIHDKEIKNLTKKGL